MNQVKQHALCAGGIILALPLISFACVRESSDTLATAGSEALHLSGRVLAGPLTLLWYAFALQKGPSLATLKANIHGCSGAEVVDCVLNTLLAVLPATLGVIAYVRIRTWDTLFAALGLWLGTGWFFGYALGRFG